MPRYIIERNVGEDAKMSKAELEEAARASMEIVSQIPGLVWIRSYISEAEGKVYCEYDAPNPDAILEHAKRSGWPADKISEIELEVSPAMFR